MSAPGTGTARATGAPPARERVYRFLRQQITSGEYRGGRRLVEEEIADELELSRTPVREALQRLASDGLVNRLRRGHLVVVEFGDEARAELHELRVSFDQAAAKLLVARTDRVDWDRLYAMLDPLAEAVAQHGTGSADYRMAHLDLHMAVNREAFAALGPSLLDRQTFLYPADDYVQQPGHEPVRQHRELLDALSSGDLARAQAAAAEHAVRAGGNR